MSNPDRVGQRSVGPDTLTSHGAVSCDLPNAAVAYPFNRRISATGVMLLGRTPLLPGNAVAMSITAPALAEWWLRPVSSATRVGEQSAATWKLL